MGYQTGLAAALARRGLTVEVVPGWQTRGSSSFAPRGAVCHWTAGARTGDRPSLNVVVNGRKDLPGPLANVFLTRSGIAVVVAAGRANHAGTGGWRGLSGNSSVFGTEAENSGNGEWATEQRWAYPRVNAAFCDLGGFGPEMVCGHNEWTPRKVDIHDYTMARMRAEVAAVLAGQGDDDMALSQDERNALFEIRNALGAAGADGKDTILGRVRNMDRQLTGADGQKVNLVQHVLNLQNSVNALKLSEGASAEDVAKAVLAALGPDLAAQVAALLTVTTKKG